MQVGASSAVVRGVSAALVFAVVVGGCRGKKAREVPNILAPPVVAPVSARTKLELTIYGGSGSEGQGGFAFVREERRVRLPAGRFVLKAPGIATGLVPQTTRFELISLDEDKHVQSAGELYEQRYLYDQLGPERLLEKAEGQRITATWWAGGRKGRWKRLTGTLISSKKGVLMRLDSGEVTPVSRSARFSFAKLPPDLVVEPTLTWNVGSYEEADARLRLNYRADGFGWRADYVVHLSPQEGKADVQGWVTVVNIGDTAFDNAKLQLLAGNVHTVTDAKPEAKALTEMYKANLDTFADDVHATEETLGELHLYTVEHPTSLPSRSSKQVRFVVAREVPTTLLAETNIELDTDSYRATLQAKLEHKDKGPLHVPLPAGRARTSARARSGLKVVVGEDSVEHTPVGEPWRVPIGAAVNQLTKTKLVSEKRLGRDPARAALLRYEIEIEIRNAAQQPRQRRVLLEPDALRLLRVSGGGARLEGPKRLVIETNLGPNQRKKFRLVVDAVDPNDVAEETEGVFSIPGLRNKRR